jgi:hypothetical protein
LNGSKTTEQWLKNFGVYIPAPLVYLNQKRWDGAEIPQISQEKQYLQQLEEDKKRAVPMPDYIRENSRR